MTNVRSIQELLISFEEYIQGQFHNKAPENLYVPVSYILGLGGKRIRPLAILVVNEVLKGNRSWAIQSSWSIELFHNFTLMHDDIMDASNLRRSLPTTHIKFGTNSAILSGDIMMIHAMENLQRLESQSGLRSLSPLFLKTATEVCEGQALDLKFEKEEAECSVEEYLEMIRLKTAVLLACSFAFGALINPHKEHLADVFYALGINLGIGFQIQDDWLDLYGESTQVGKQKGGDILRCKKTILALELWPFLSKSDKQFYNQPAESEKEAEKKIHYFEQLFIKFQVKEKVLIRLDQYRKNCEMIMKDLNEKGIEVQLLHSFIQDVWSRRY